MQAGVELLAHRAASEAEGASPWALSLHRQSWLASLLTALHTLAHTHTHAAASGKFDADMTRLFPIVQLTNSPFLSQIPR